MIRKLAVQVPGAQVRESDRRIEFPGGGWLQVKSAHDPDSLRGEGLDFVAFDECAFAPERAWLEALRPSLADRQGSAMFISTPKGRNWFWQAWLRGQGEDADWQSWQFPTASNPYIAGVEIDAAQRSLPARIFQQEFLAAFLEDAGAVFRRVTDAIREPQPASGRVVFGVDWGKHSDFTVIVAVDPVTGQQVGLDRFNQIDYAVQRQRLMAMAQRYKPEMIIAESNAMGEPIIEQLQRDNLPVHGFQTTNQSKAMIIESLALAFEQGEIGIQGEPVLINELQAYELDRLPSGLIRYNAPDGMHDDCVIALALAWHAARGGRIIQGPLAV